MKLLSKISAVLFPPRCVLCDSLLNEAGLDICPTCSTAARIFLHHPWKINHVKSWFALWQYGSAVRNSLVRYKFHNRRSYCRTYGRELAKKLPDWKIDYDVISWIPVSRLRKITRGYDQVELVAEVLCRELGQCSQCLLHKWKHNRKQSTIRGLEGRQKNVQGVYRMMPGVDVKGKRILLVEDIVTTGATVSEAASVLRAAGAKEVHVICLAVANKYHN